MQAGVVCECVSHQGRRLDWDNTAVASACDSSSWTSFLSPAERMWSKSWDALLTHRQAKDKARGLSLDVDRNQGCDHQFMLEVNKREKNREEKRIE